MNCACAAARPLAYWLIIAGCGIALVTAFQPDFTAGWHLSTDFLVCGVLPYVVYGSFTQILSGSALLAGGSLLLLADLVGRQVFGVTAAATLNPFAPVWLCTVLIVLVLPLAVLLGAGIDRLLSGGQSAQAR
jgi:hypothetical protein